MAKESFWTKLTHLFSKPKKITIQPAKVKEGIWYQQQADGNYLLGIDNSVYEQIGKLTFADFPTQLDKIAIDDDLLDIEGDKSVETLKSPIAGKVIAINHEIGANVEQLNTPDPKTNWIVKVTTQK